MAKQNESTVGSRRIPWELYALVLLSSALLAIRHLSGGFTEHGLQMFTRHTARQSFLIFLLPFLATPLSRTFPSTGTRWLAQKRRYLGLSFALSHFIHLAALIGYFVVSGKEPGIVTLLGGGSVYVVIALMALTSNDWSMKTLRRNWKLLQTFGMYAIWFIFAQSYAGRVFGQRADGLADASDQVIYQGLLAAALAALTFRIVTGWARRRRTRRSSSPSTERAGLTA